MQLLQKMQQLRVMVKFILLSKNNILYKQNGELRINDNALVSLALLTASSDPKQKELMVKLVVNLLTEEKI